MVRGWVSWRVAAWRRVNVCVVSRLYDVWRDVEKEVVTVAPVTLERDWLREASMSIVNVWLV
jgi:hypothetical protein